MGNRYFNDTKKLLIETRRLLEGRILDETKIGNVICFLIQQDSRVYYREIDIPLNRLFSCVLYLNTDGRLSLLDKERIREHLPTVYIQQALMKIQRW